MVSWEHYQSKGLVTLVRVELPVPAISRQGLVDVVAAAITPRTKVKPLMTAADCEPL
jgi:hypothetical protein